MCLELGMPEDEQLHALKCQFEYEMCLQHCPFHGTEKCMGVDFCAHYWGFSLL